MNNIIIWGAGNRTKTCIERNYFSGSKIIAIVDSNVQGATFCGYSLIKPDEIDQYEDYDCVIVCNQYYQEIVVKLLELHIPLEKIVITDHVKEEPYNHLFKKAQMYIPMIYNMNKDVIKQTVKSNERDAFDTETIYADQKFQDMEYEFDYFRYRTFEFAAEELKNNQIEGALVEVGVFRGLFSAVANSKFPERKIYLFDTFEGFKKEEAKKEYEHGNCSSSFIESHRDTSVERMLGNLPYPDKAVVCKGFFPESITEEAVKEKYAFVSLDVDFEESTFEGLKFFYPRLSEGGYIFIHDYNTYYLKGVKAAVKRYEEFIGQKLKAIPIADRAGTLIIMK